MKPLQILGAGWGLGAKDPGCADAWDYLMQRGIAEQLQREGFVLQWGPVLRPGTDGLTIDKLINRLAFEVGTVVALERKFLVIGGDHSCAAGTWNGAAAAKDGRLGLVWFDAHMDAHTPVTSPSGALHGMPLTALLGISQAVDTFATGPFKLQPARTCLVGVRSFEAQEAALLDDLQVRVFFMEEVNARGLEAVLRDALRLVTYDSAGFGVSVDLDVVEPAQAPGVGTPVPGGLHAADLVRGLRFIASHSQFVGAELAEFNPHRDRQDKTARIVYDLIHAVAQALSQA